MSDVSQQILEKALSSLQLGAEAKEALILHWTKELNLGRKDFLIQQGQIEKNIYFILSGTFRIYVATDDSEVCVGFGYPNTLISSFASLVNDKASDYYIESLSKAKLLVLPKKVFFDHVDNYPSIASFWRKQLEQVLVGRMNREVELLTLNPQERYQRLIDRSPYIFQHIPQKYIASYLAMTPETLSRVKKS